jgi:hypothetical protein
VAPNRMTFMLFLDEGEQIGELRHSGTRSSRGPGIQTHHPACRIPGSRKGRAPE